MEKTPETLIILGHTLRKINSHMYEAISLESVLRVLREVNDIEWVGQASLTHHVSSGRDSTVSVKTERYDSPALAAKALEQALQYWRLSEGWRFESKWPMDD